MIHGIGCDITEIARVQLLLKRYGERFEHRVFTENERVQAHQQTSPITRYAKYITAKEAAFKAMCVGRDKGMSWQDFEVTYAETGQPQMKLSAKALKLLPAKARAHLSLSDTDALAMAYVVIEAN